MNVSWIERTQKTLDQLQKIKDKRDIDRLEIVKSMRFSFGALSQSLGGWMQWVNSPEIMSQFPFTGGFGMEYINLNLMVKEILQLLH